jgi:ATP-binding cassette subfamily C protein
MGVRQADVLTILTTNVVWVDQAVQALMGIAAVGFLVVAQVAVALRISPTFTGLAVISGIGLIAVVWPLVRWSKTLGGQLVERNRVVTRLATGFLDALKLAKAYGREDAHVEQFEHAIGSARQAKIAFVRASGIATGLQLALTALLLAVTVDLGIRVLHVPIGSMLVIAYAFTRVIGQLTASQSNIQQVAQGLAAFDEAMALIESCEAAQELAPTPRATRKPVAIGQGIALEDVHFTYPQRAAGRVEALAGVSFELPVGGTVALAGPSGAGKTTVADLVAGLLRPSAGIVTVGGEPLSRDRVHGWRDAIALVPQDPFLFHETIAENLRWACPDASEREIWEALAMSAAAEFVELLPSGLDTLVGDRGMQLSGGERQRLALARALLRRPQLLILDEATSSLDNENERAIRAALASLRGKMTMLVIAHRLSTAAEADEIVVLEHGCVVETGSWSQLTHDPLGRLQALIEAGGRAAVG